jgi:fatty-acyl-CoA synthase
MFHSDLIGERARLTPEREAVVEIVPGSEPRRFSYAELSARAERTARLLTGSYGLTAGDRVALLSHNRVEFLDVFFAGGKSGVIIVPLSTRATPHELQRIVADSGARLLLHSSEFEGHAGALLETRTVSRAERIDGDEWARSVESMPPGDTGYRGAPEEIRCLLYTSGTTGSPKGVMLSNRMIGWNAWNTAVNWGLREDDRSPVFTPLYHAGGLGAFLMPIFAAGGTIILHRRFDPGEVWDVVQRERCSVVLGVPTIWKMLMEHPSFAGTDLGSLRWVISGGAPLPAYIIEEYQKRGVVFKQGYGMTEVGVNCFSMTVEESFRKAGSIGRPMLYTEARLVDAAGCDVPAGEVGELWLRGPHVSSGYWQNPAATEECYLPDGWFRTGDFARRDEEGFFYMAGRKKEMFISGGVNVYPAEIEGELLSHPAVSDAAVIGVADGRWGEVGVAFVVDLPGENVSDEELTTFLAARIARYKLPSKYVRLVALPRTPYGKVVKEELRRMLGDDRA